MEGEDEKRQWNVVHDCDGEDGTPSVWSLKIGDNQYYWIDETPDNTFNVIDTDGKTVLKNCRSLRSAKRWVAVYLL